MRKYVKACALFCALFVILATVSVAFAAGDGSLKRVKDAGKLTIGAEGNWVPFVYNDVKTNELTGFEVAIAKEIAKRLGVKAEFNIANKWDGVLAGLDAKRYDTVICGCNPNPDRLVKYNMSVAYAETPVCLVVAKDNKDIKNFADLKGKLCGNALTSSSGAIARKNGAELRDCSLTQAMDLLATKRIDGTINTTAAIEDYLKQKPNTPVKIVAIYKPEKSYEIESSAMLRKEDVDLSAAFDKTIKAMIADGTCYKLAQQFFGKQTADSISLYPQAKKK